MLLFPVRAYPNELIPVAVTLKLAALYSNDNEQIYIINFRSSFLNLVFCISGLCIFTVVLLTSVLLDLSFC